MFVLLVYILNKANQIRIQLYLNAVVRVSLLELLCLCLFTSIANHCHVLSIIDQPRSLSVSAAVQTRNLCSLVIFVSGCGGKAHRLLLNRKIFERDMIIVIIIIIIIIIIIGLFCNKEQTNPLSLLIDSIERAEL